MTPSDGKNISGGSPTLGINVPEAMGAGQLEVRPWEDGPLRGGRFDLETWLTSFEQVIQSGPAAGYAQTRIMGQMEWALVDLPGVGDLIEFETRVNYRDSQVRESSDLRVRSDEI